MRLFMTREEREEIAKAHDTRETTRSGTAPLATMVLGAVAGAAALYLLDPRLGRRRRAMLGDRVGATARRGARRLERLTRYAGSTVSSTRERVVGQMSDDGEYVDDATVTDRVESQVFRDRDLPKGEINIDTVGGVVMIRGEVDRPDIMNEIVARTWRVDGVKDVRNLMHLPGTPAPHID